MFEGSVACELLTRVAILPGAPPPGALESAERLLLDIAATEERRAEPDDGTGAGDPAYRRLEAKLDLALQLLAQALPNVNALALRSVRLAAAGIAIDAPLPVPVGPAHLAWQPSEALPLSLHLPVRAVDGPERSAVWAFGPLPTGLQEALERHVFRMHRRALAASRRG